eukprot:3205651-Rhodomonas_salina.1
MAWAVQYWASVGLTCSSQSLCRCQTTHAGAAIAPYAISVPDIARGPPRVSTTIRELSNALAIPPYGRGIRDHSAGVFLLVRRLVAPYTSSVPH